MFQQNEKELPSSDLDDEDDDFYDDDEEEKEVDHVEIGDILNRHKESQSQLALDDES